MKKSDLQSGIVILVVSLALFGVSFGIHEDIVPGDRLGSRFFPRLVVILLASCAAMIIRSGLKARSLAASGTAMPQPDRGRRTPGRAAWTIGLSFAYIIFFKSLGVIVVTPLVVLGMLLAWGVKRKTNLVLIPILSTAALYLIFGYAFEIMLPMGVLG